MIHNFSVKNLRTDHCHWQLETRYASFTLDFLALGWDLTRGRSPLLVYAQVRKLSPELIETLTDRT